MQLRLALTRDPLASRLLRLWVCTTLLIFGPSLNLRQGLTLPQAGLKLVAILPHPAVLPPAC